eukprot:gene6732-10897_t
MNLLKEIFTRTNFDQEEKYNIYLTGSRVYGTHSKTSDYDIYIITTDEYFQKLSKKKQNEEEYECLYFDDININLYSKRNFEQKLKENWLQALMCFYSSKENVLVKSFDFSFEILYRKLGKSVIGESGKHYEMARRKWDSENLYCCKKYLIHSFRDFMFGIQIAKKFKIENFQSANDLYKEVMEETKKEWEFYDGKYHKIYEDLKVQFQNEVIYKNENERLNSFLSENKNRLQLLNLYFSIQISTNDNFIFLKSDLKESPKNYKIVKECEGLILKKYTCSIVCYPQERIYNCNDHFCDKLNLNNTSVYFNFDFIFVNLWFDSLNKRWNFSTRESMESSKYLKIFEQEFKNQLQFPDKEDEKFTFTFTFQKEDTFIVHRDLMDSIFLFSVRDNTDGKKMKISKFTIKYENWKKMDEIYFSIKNLDFLFEKSFSLDPMKYKGFLLQDKDFNQMYIDSSNFTSLRSLLNGKNIDSSVLDLKKLTSKF